MRMIKWSVAICALLAAPPSLAQKCTTLQAFFEGRLNGEPVEWTHSKTLKMKQLESGRRQIWQAWKEANAQYEEERLIALQPLSAAAGGSWKLPSALEPNAVLPYYYGSKGERPEQGYPLFLYLHGSGPKDAEWATGLKLAQVFEDGPSAYFVPQIPNEGAYYRWYQRSKQYAWSRLLRQVMLSDDINPNRLYLFGISEGGYGSQRMASFYADYLAAAGPMAGGEPLKNAPAENCRNIGFSLLTGALDKGFYRDVLTSYIQTAFDSLEQADPGAYPHRIELVPGKGHSIDYRPTTPWLSRFVRQPWPKQFVWEDYEMDGIHRSGFYNIVVRERPDAKLRTRYDVSIADNEVQVTVRNVHYETVQKDPHWGIEMKFRKTYTPAQRGRFTLYLNEHLVNLRKKVRVVVNGKEVFYGKLRCTTGNMANSVAAFYDSQRIYPAAVEVNL